MMVMAAWQNRLSFPPFFIGKYLLVRDPNKAQLRLYALPAGVTEAAAESEGEIDDDEDQRDDADE